LCYQSCQIFIALVAGLSIAGENAPSPPTNHSKDNFGIQDDAIVHANKRGEALAY
jgi:hypothetical protein